MKKALIVFVFFSLFTVNSGAYSIAMTGDIMIGTTLPEKYLPAFDGGKLFQYVSTSFKSVDFVIGNLEGTLCDTPGTPRPCTNPKTYYIFKMPQRYARLLKEAGYDAVNIATNHINDVGQEGRDSTMSALKSAGIAFSGLKDRCESQILMKNGKLIGICSFCDSDNSVDINDIPYAKSLVCELKKHCDYVIVSFHGGAEGTTCTHVPRKIEYHLGEKRGDVYALAHACIDAGADLVFGHGPHVPRAVELYKGHLIAYSLGNFCTPIRVSLRDTYKFAPLIIAEIDENGHFIKGRIESYIQKAGSGPIYDELGTAAEMIKKSSQEDFPESKILFQGNNILPQ